MDTKSSEFLREGEREEGRGRSEEEPQHLIPSVKSNARLVSG